jgi:hypothetical protein
MRVQGFKRYSFPVVFFKPYLYIERNQIKAVSISLTDKSKPCFRHAKTGLAGTPGPGYTSHCSAYLSLELQVHQMRR